MISKYSVLIREAHLDTFGHVNNATYMSLFEEARWDLITSHGYGLKQVQQLKKGPIILEANLKFQKELKLREEITITTEMLHYTKKIGQLKQEMLRPNGDIACVAIFTMGLFDLTERKLIEPTPEWKKAIGMD